MNADWKTPPVLSNNTSPMVIGCDEGEKEADKVSIDQTQQRALLMHSPLLRLPQQGLPLGFMD
jgi:hypothetical protein